VIDPGTVLRVDGRVALVTGGGTNLGRAAARELVAAVVAEGHDDGTIRDGDPARMAAAIESAARGPALALSSLRRSERRALLAELEAMLDAYLRPAE
jgi:NAD(P)-dependent dehydrogenase (short-subunit alcohol dehydrogenase family)